MSGSESSRIYQMTRPSRTEKVRAFCHGRHAAPDNALQAETNYGPCCAAHGNGTVIMLPLHLCFLATHSTSCSPRHEDSRVLGDSALYYVVHRVENDACDTEGCGRHGGLIVDVWSNVKLSCGVEVEIGRRKSRHVSARLFRAPILPSCISVLSCIISSQSPPQPLPTSHASSWVRRELPVSRQVQNSSYRSQLSPPSVSYAVLAHVAFEPVMSLAGTKQVDNLVWATAAALLTSQLCPHSPEGYVPVCAELICWALLLVFFHFLPRSFLRTCDYAINGSANNHTRLSWAAAASITVTTLSSSVEDIGWVTVSVVL